jgi:flagellar biogenesis protein FliO
MDFLQPLAAIGFVLALLGGVLMVLRKRGAVSFAGGGRRMKCVERLALGPGCALHLVEVDGRLILVGTGITEVGK